MKKSRQFRVEIASILILAILLTLIIAGKENSAKDRVTFVIKSGEALSVIAERLESEGIIHDSNFFVLLAKVLKIDNKIKSGEYQLSKGLYEYNALMKIYRGEVLLRKLVIPEGFCIKQIAQAVNNVLGIAEKDFIRECSSSYLLRKYSIPGNTCEGYLFPDTYLFTKGVNAETVVNAMLERFFSQFPKDSFRENNMGFSMKEYIVLASIIEKEAVVDNERPVIAGIFYNRLEKGMHLQSCATVLYAMGETGGRVITYTECEFDSPYNTYKYPGLPPMPICSPGRESIEASLNPDENDYLFYVAKGDGTHYFSRTYNEHLNIQKNKK